MKYKNKGFTLIELLAVIIIISVLALVIVASISTYMKSSKDKYNEELKEQLLITAKNYLSENPNLLPRKTYLEKSEEKHTVVTLQEMESRNFTKNEFYDADKRPCKNSYIIASIPAYETKEKYHSCLICGEGSNIVNYSEDDNYCHISNFSKGENPTCNSAQSGGTLSSSIRYNPTSIKIDEISGDIDNAGITQIWIENKTTNSVKVIDVKDKSITQIKSMNLKNYLTKDGKYEIKIRDARGNFSSETCNKETIIIDKTKPTCELTYDKNTQQFVVNTKDSISSNITKIVLNTKVEASIAFDKTGITKPLKDGKYYGYVKDEAGNINECENSKDDGYDIDIIVKENEKPRCSPLSGEYTLLNTNKKEATYKVECYVYNGQSGTIDNNKITTKNDRGEITEVTKDETNPNKDNKVIVNIKYTANNNTTGTDNVIVGAGFVKSGSLANDSLTLQTSDFNIDTTKPVTDITSTNRVASSQTATLTCSDSSKIVSYYWGTTAPTSSSSYTTVTPKVNYSTTKTISQPGTYYFACKDSSGNVSTTKSKTFYKTTFDMTNGTVTPTSVITMQGNKFTLPTPTANSGYIINGNWYISRFMTGKISSPYTPNTSRTLYSKANSNTYTISFSCPSGTSNCPSNTKVEKGKSYTIPSTRPSLSGYNFYKWNTASDGTGTKYNAGGTISSVTSNITLYPSLIKPIFENFTCPRSIPFMQGGRFNWDYDSTVKAYSYAFSQENYTRIVQYKSNDCALKNSYDRGYNCANGIWFDGADDFWINTYDYTDNSSSSNRYSNINGVTHTIIARTKIVLDGSTTFYSGTESCTYSAD